MSVKFVRVLTVSIGLVLAIASMPGASAAATTGFLDKTFSGDGRVLTNVGGDDDVQAVAIQADGKIVVAGSSSGGTDVAVVRYNADGTLDTGFGGGDGVVITDVNGDDFALSIAIQNDQKILVGGATDGVGSALLIRYGTSGTPDATFGGGDGIVATTIGLGAVFTDLAVQGDGAIVAAGAATLDGAKGVALVARYDSSGVLDTANFASPDGYVTTNLGAGGGQIAGVALQADGKIVGAGSSYSTTSSNVALLRYTTAGVLDTTFGGGDGKVTTDVGTGYDTGNDVAIDGDGNIVVGALGGNKDVFLRYDDTGTLDATFGGGDGIAPVGKGGYNGLAGIAIRGTGEIVGVDSTFGSGFSGAGMFKAVQVTSTGALDPAFGDNGVATAAFSLSYRDLPTANDVAIDGNGAVVVAGTAGAHADVAVARFGDVGDVVLGQPDLHIGTGGTFVGDDVYNETGHHQTLARRVARGHSLTYSIEVQNDGNAPDVIVLHAFPVGGASVTYSLGGTSITRAMARNGKALTIVAGASKTVKVVVKVGDNTAVGKVLKVRTFGYSFNTADAEDLVLAAITVKR
jgi:uncharacterized delta-60 repeat protein